MPTNTDPAAVTDMARRREATTFHGDEAQFWLFDLADGGRVHIPPDQVRRLWNAEQLQQQLKGCECPARKALQRMMDEHGHDCDCIPMVLCEYCEGRAAISAPCPCEGLRADEPSAEAWKELVRWAHGADRSQEGVRLIYEITTHYLAMRRERDSLRAENERLKRSLDWITAEKHGAQTDAEREKNVADSLRAELAAEKERSANLEMARDIAQERADRIEAASWNALKLAQSLHDLSLKSGADLAASQERERLLREALALAESWVVADGAHGRADRPDIDASRSSRRAKAIDQINEAFRLATPEGTVRP